MSKRENRIWNVVITLSVCFMTGHSRAGQPTGFADKLESGRKKHTIRANYEYWAGKARLINEGRMVLHIRQWVGRPYYSPQVELRQMHSLRIQKISVYYAELQSVEPTVVVDGRVLSQQEVEQLAYNDGLSYEEWLEWMCPKRKPLMNGVILHLTDDLSY